MKRSFVWIFAAFISLIASIRLAAGMMGLIPNPMGFAEASGFVLATMIFSVMGALIVLRTGGNRVGWLMLLLGFVLADPFRTTIELNYAALQSNISFWMYFAIWTQGWFFFLIIYAVFLIILHFPDGHPPTPRWNWVNIISLSTLGQFILTYTFQPQFGDEGLQVNNPIAMLPVNADETISGMLFGLGLIFLGVSSLSSIFVRYRRSGSIIRAQIRWLMFAGVIAFFAIGFRLANYSPGRNDWTDYLLVFAILVLTMSISVAILRYRLYNIDLIIRRTLQYALLTGILVIVFLGGVAFLQGVFQGIIGSRDSPLITVISTLLIAALFNPLRLRTQDWIDRRF